MNPLNWGLVPQILLGVVLGALAGVGVPDAAVQLGLLGQLFVGMLKAVAPLLVMVLVMSAIANRHESGSDGRKTFATIALYLVGTVSAAVVALALSQLFPQTLALTEAAGRSAGQPRDALLMVMSSIASPFIL